MPNAGFDVASLTGWIAFGSTVTMSIATPDVANCASSGSLFVTYSGDLNSTLPAAAPCVSITAGTAYNVGGWVYVPSGRVKGSASLSVNWYTEATCNNLAGTGADRSVSVQAADTTNVWQYLHLENVTPPAGTLGAMADAWVGRLADGTPVPGAYFDALYITPAPGRF
jgi:hypothetical protein